MVRLELMLRAVDWLRAPSAHICACLVVVIVFARMHLLSSLHPEHAKLEFIQLLQPAGLRSSALFGQAFNPRRWFQLGRRRIICTATPIAGACQCLITQDASRGHIVRFRSGVMLLHKRCRGLKRAIRLDHHARCALSPVIHLQHLITSASISWRLGISCDYRTHAIELRRGSLLHNSRNWRRGLRRRFAFLPSLGWHGRPAAHNCVPLRQICAHAGRRLSRGHTGVEYLYTIVRI